VDQVSVEKVKGGDEKLVGVLLLVPCQVMCMLPRHVEKEVRY